MVSIVREVTLDTETTGGSSRKGDKVIEIGMVELIDGRATGQIYHEFVDPQRDVHFGALRVHGLSRKALLGQPLFVAISQDARDFIGDAPTLVHNVPFDKGFMNKQFAESGTPIVPNAQWRETMTICRRHFNDGQGVKLDRVVERLGIQTPDRTVHGALLDAAILAAVVCKIRNQPEIDIADLVSRGNEHRVRRKDVKGWNNRKPAAQTTAAAAAARPAAPPPPPPDNRAILAELNAKPAAVDREMYKNLRSGRDQWSSTPADQVIANSDPAFEGKSDLRDVVHGMSERARLASLRWVCRGLAPEHALCMCIVLDEVYDRPPEQPARNFALALTADKEPELDLDDGFSP
ncbi:MAG: exonuclease domain-containing protein [Roseibium sp.]|uniref:exonuclease domain-containing protein n=1 Tax=Roseibium sp. TaxID=1936156 RepID=UPI0032983C04